MKKAITLLISAAILTSNVVMAENSDTAVKIYVSPATGSDSNIKARFTNDRLSFYQGASEVAYISGSSLYITNADVLDYLRIGNSSQGYFLFDTTSNGLEVRWIDGK